MEKKEEPGEAESTRLFRLLLLLQRTTGGKVGPTSNNRLSVVLIASVPTSDILLRCSATADLEDKVPNWHTWVMLVGLANRLVSVNATMKARPFLFVCTCYEIYKWQIRQMINILGN